MPSPTARSRPSRTAWTLTCVLAVAAALAAFLAAPRTPPPGAEASGDAEIAERLRPMLSDGDVGVSVALTHDGDTRYAGLGTAEGTTPVGPDTPFETASVQKLLTATLLADMVRSGEVELSDTLGRLWPDTDFGDDAVAGITLEQLATHTSGLPSIPIGAERGVLAALPVYALGGDAYSWLGDPVETATRITGIAPGSFGYSNLGYALLGQTLARTADRDYAGLLAERVLEPLDMDRTGARDTGVPDGAALPHLGALAPAQPWTNPGYAPAGTGTWTTTSDLSGFLTATADGALPGTDLSHTPRVEAADYRAYDGHVGLGWMLWRVDGTGVAWHNGLTNGTRTFVAHTDDGRSVVVLANSTRTPVERIGFTLLGLEVPEFTENAPGPVPVGVTLLLAVGVPAVAAARMPRTGGGRFSRPLDRLAIVSHLLMGAALWLLALRVGAWGSVPPALWACGGGLLATAAALGAHRWRHVPLVRDGRAVRRWLVFVPSAVLAVSLLCLEASVLAGLP